MDLTVNIGRGAGSFDIAEYVITLSIFYATDGADGKTTWFGSDAGGTVDSTVRIVQNADSSWTDYMYLGHAVVQQDGSIGLTAEVYASGIIGRTPLAEALYSLVTINHVSASDIAFALFAEGELVLCNSAFAESIYPARSSGSCHCGCIALTLLAVYAREAQILM